MKRQCTAALLMLPLALAVDAQHPLHGVDRPEDREPICVAVERAHGRGDIADRVAFSTYAACIDAGPVLIARAWAKLPVDSARLQDLVWSSRLLHDERAAVAVLAVLQKTDAPLVTRLAALRVIAAYIQPNLWIAFRPVGRTMPVGGSVVESWSFRTQTLTLTIGRQPISEAVREKLLQGLRAAAAMPQDEFLRVGIAEVLMAVDRPR